MSPATMPAPLREAVRLLFVDGGHERLEDHAFTELPELLAAGDLLVVNDAATLPASLPGSTAAGEGIELRLLGARAGADPSEGDGEGQRWWAVLFGAGDWRADTDQRPPPPPLELGAQLHFAGGLRAELVARGSNSERLLEVRFDRSGPALWAALYQAGAPVQYSHLRAPLDLWSVQTVFASRPWAVEMPSAGRPLSWALLAKLRQRGVEVARLTHAAGLSATGDPALDRSLPLPERYEIPAQTVAGIRRARARGARVIAAGTTVVRALESEAAAIVETTEPPRTLAGVTELVLTPEHRRRVVDGLITGMHGPGESHYRLLGAFLDRPLLERAWQAALGAGYRSHEFGDLALLLSDRSLGYAQ